MPSSEEGLNFNMVRGHRTRLSSDGLRKFPLIGEIVGLAVVGYIDGGVVQGQGVVGEHGLAGDQPAEGIAAVGLTGI